MKTLGRCPPHHKFRLAATTLIVAAAAGPLALARAVDSPAAILLDGQCDSGYQPIASDPANDLAPVFANSPATSWAELSTLYAANDADTLFLCVPLAPDYALAQSSGEFGLAIDVTGDQPNSGSADDPWTSGITFAYSATLEYGAAGPTLTSHTILPDFFIRGSVAGIQSEVSANENDGWTELLRWVGQDWQGRIENWGGIDEQEQVGTHVAYKDSTGLEMTVPFTALQLMPGTPLLLELFVTRIEDLPGANGAYDSLPSDTQADGTGAGTTQRTLARYNPVPPDGAAEVRFQPAEYFAAEDAGSAALMLTRSGPLTLSLPVTLTLAGGTASSQDFGLAQFSAVFPAGGSSVEFPVTLVNDDVVEANETISITIERAAGAWLGSPLTAILTILDDDNEAPTATDSPPTSTNTPPTSTATPATATAAPSAEPPLYKLWLAVVRR